MPPTVGTTAYVKHRIARQKILRNLPWFAPRSAVVLLLSTPVAKPLLRRGYDRYMQTRTHPKHTRATPTIH